MRFGSELQRAFAIVAVLAERDGRIDDGQILVHPSLILAVPVKQLSLHPLEIRVKSRHVLAKVVRVCRIMSTPVLVLERFSRLFERSIPLLQVCSQVFHPLMSLFQANSCGFNSPSPRLPKHGPFLVGAVTKHHFAVVAFLDKCVE
jgi:hypothetical protein